MRWPTRARCRSPTRCKRSSTTRPFLHDIGELLAEHLGCMNLRPPSRVETSAFSASTRTAKSGTRSPRRRAGATTQPSARSLPAVLPPASAAGHRSAGHGAYIEQRTPSERFTDTLPGDWALEPFKARLRCRDKRKTAAKAQSSEKSPMPKSSKTDKSSTTPGLSSS